MTYKPCNFRRQEYLENAELFEAVNIDTAEYELREYNDDPVDLAFELAYTRYRVAKLEQFIRNGIEFGYISVPGDPDTAREIISEILEGE